MRIFRRCLATPFALVFFVLFYISGAFAMAAGLIAGEELR